MVERMAWINGRWAVQASLIAGLILVGCGSDTETDGQPDAGGSSGVDGTSGTDVTEGTDGTTGTPAACTPAEVSDFALIFGYRNKIPGVAEFDLNMMRPVQKYEPVKLTNFSLKETGTTCQWGCTIDEDIDWIAVNSSEVSALGFDFSLGRFNACLEVALVKGVTLQDKPHFVFAKNFIYYSERIDGCNGQVCQYAIKRLNLDTPTVPAEIIVPAFPPQEDPDWVDSSTVYRGRFRVSPDGQSVVILSPTIRSQRVYIWNGTLHQVEFLCENMQNNTCIGTGSQFSDNDPVAISPDGKSVVLFSIDNQALRVRRFSTENLNDKGQSALLSVQSVTGSTYQSAACALKEPWQFTRIIGDPHFTPDGKYVVFAGGSSCDPDSIKDHTNIYKIDPSWIGDLSAVEEHEVINLTNNPTGTIPANREVTSMSLTPDGNHVVFTATPHLDSQWKPLKDTDKRQTDDHEVYIVSICGGEPTQLTSNVTFDASGPKAFPLPDLSNCPVSPLPEVSN